MTDNLYRIDDTLIRSGYILGAVILAATLTGVAKTILYLLPLWSFPFLTLLVIAPIAMLVAGYLIRQREKRLVEIWRVVQNHGEISGRELAHMSGLSRDNLREAIAQLNRKSAAGLIWDNARDSIRQVTPGDGQLLMHSERCPSCGASVSVEVASRSRADELTCPYCAGALDAASINQLQTHLMDRDDRKQSLGPTERSAAATAAAAPPQSIEEPATAPEHMASPKRFSLVVFVLLMMFFWPAAVWYAIARAQSGQLSL